MYAIAYLTQGIQDTALNCSTVIDLVLRHGVSAYDDTLNCAIDCESLRVTAHS